MNILIISYGIKEYDGRLGELEKLFSQLGDVKTIACSYSNTHNAEENTIILDSENYLSKKNYLKFISSAIKSAYQVGKVDILVADNMFAALPVILLKKLLKPKYVIQDVRELYFYEEIKSKVGRRLSKLETHLMKSSDVVLCANRQRSKLMKEHYNLDRHPTVFENIRFLEDEFNNEELSEKYRNEFKFHTNLISTGGLSIQRETHKLVESMKNLPNDVGLYLVGDGTTKDKLIIENIIQENKLGNVRMLNKVPLSELRFLMNKCEIGIVHYNKLDLNNQYCASGKVYEFLAEGLPIVTTENLPLKDFCNETKVGISDDSFSDGIIQIKKNYDIYKKRVENFISNLSVEKYHKEVSKEILLILNKGVLE